MLQQQHSVWALFLGRIIQGVLVLPHGFLRLRCWWITSSRRLERKGATLAFAMPFVTSGVIGGPVISGSLFRLAGH